MPNNREWPNKLWYMRKLKYCEIIKITFLKIQFSDLRTIYCYHYFILCQQEEEWQYSYVKT